MKLLFKIIDFNILLPLMFAIVLYCYFENTVVHFDSFIISVLTGYGVGFTLDFFKKAKKRVKVWEQ